MFAVRNVSFKIHVTSRYNISAVLWRTRNRIIRASRGYNSSPDTIQTLRRTDAPYVRIYRRPCSRPCVPHRNEDDVFAMIVRERDTDQNFEFQNHRRDISWPSFVRLDFFIIFFTLRTVLFRLFGEGRMQSSRIKYVYKNEVPRHFRPILWVSIKKSCRGPYFTIY